MMTWIQPHRRKRQPIPGSFWFSSDLTTCTTTAPCAPQKINKQINVKHSNQFTHRDKLCSPCWQMVEAATNFKLWCHNDSQWHSPCFLGLRHKLDLVKNTELGVKICVQFWVSLLVHVWCWIKYLKICCFFFFLSLPLAAWLSLVLIGLHVSD